MRGPKALFEAENNLVTEMGAWFPGERVVFRGKDLHHDLADLSWMELYLFGITGRRFDDKHVKLFNALWVLTSYPDSRLWNNRVVALGGSSRSTLALSLSAGIGVSEASIYGRRLDVRAIDFLYRAKNAKAELNLESFIESELKTQRAIPGYGRPVTKEDERIEALLKLLEEFGIEKGLFLNLSEEVAEILSRRWRLKSNYAAFCAALAADAGLSTHEYYRYSIMAFSAGMPPCYVDQARVEGAFFPLQCGRIDYTGEADRRYKS